MSLSPDRNISVKIGAISVSAAVYYFPITPLEVVRNLPTETIAAARQVPLNPLNESFKSTCVSPPSVNDVGYFKSLLNNQGKYMFKPPLALSMSCRITHYELFQKRRLVTSEK